MNENIKAFVRNPLVTLLSGGVIGGAAGAAGMYILSRRKAKEVEGVLVGEINRLEKQIQHQNQEKQELNAGFREVAVAVKELKEMGIDMLHDLKGDEEPFNAPLGGELVGEAIGVMTSVTEDDEGVAVEGILTEEGVGVIRNIFDAADNGWDYEAERKTRTKDAPYIIHVDEFQADENDWNSQSTLTWYAGDEILTDSNDVPIYNPHTVVGELRFGHGSGDPSVVYVRNERLQAEYEILLEEGSYEVIVLGGESDVEDQYEKSDLKHSRTPPKFRGD